jgi:hypothetical protein
MSTLTQLTDNTRSKLKIDPMADIWSDTELQTYIGEALTLFYSKANMKDEWEDSTQALLVAGTGSYTKPADCRRILWAKLYDKTAASTEADESPLTIVTDTLAEFQEGRDMEAQGDTPGYIYEEGGSLWLYPVPNAAAVAKWGFKIKYSERPATLTAATSPAFASEWHFVLEDYAVWRAWAKLPGKQNEAEAALRIWEKNWRSAMQDIVWTTGEYQQFRMPILPSKRRK